MPSQRGGLKILYVSLSVKVRVQNREAGIRKLRGSCTAGSVCFHWNEFTDCN